ncbi:MAG: LAGLIDADG family homing endonuclease [Candidatus Paceibacterota bacterium]
MGKRGPKPKKTINDKWTPKLAYAIGLLATDGCLSKDGFLIDLTSKDKEQLLNFSRCLEVNFFIGKKWNRNGDLCFRIQFKNKIFFNFLLSIKLTSKKSLTIGRILIPDRYFFDFLRGCFDGDGSFYSYWDLRWNSSHMFYLEFVSASKKHILWLRKKLKSKLEVKGHITKNKERIFFQLRYAKKESLEIIKKMYYNNLVICLSRKQIKIKEALKIEAKQQEKYNAQVV